MKVLGLCKIVRTFLKEETAQNRMPKSCPLFKQPCLESGCALWVEKVDFGTSSEIDEKSIRIVNECAIVMAAIGSIKMFQFDWGGKE